MTIDAKAKLIDLRHRIVNEGYAPTLDEQKEAVQLLRDVRENALAEKGKRKATAKPSAAPIDLESLFGGPK